MKNTLFLAFALTTIAPIARAQVSPSPAQSFNTSARLETVNRSGKSWRAAATYPIFRSNNRLTRYANQQARVDAQLQLKSGIGELTKYLSGDPIPENPYAWELSPRLSFYGPNLISIEQSVYYDMGGAHPNSVLSTRNYGISAGKPKRLTLSDFFKSGSPYRTATATKLLARLKENGADWVVGGTVKSLTTDQLNNFVVEPDGLKWVFSPYEMAPYSAGVVKAKLKFSDLGSDFRRELLRR